jgi:hypothetical protein
MAAAANYLGVIEKVFWRRLCRRRRRPRQVDGKTSDRGKQRIPATSSTTYSFHVKARLELLAAIERKTLLRF